MIPLNERIELIHKAGEKLNAAFSDPNFASVFSMAESSNPWFTQSNIKKSIDAIYSKYTSADKLNEWISNYTIPENTKPKKLGLLLAGNIPFVGIHDVISGFAAGHELHIKFSDKDSYLMPFFIKLITEENEKAESYFTEVERMNGIDLVIATGSNNTSRYFDYYFSKMPNIIRKNRVSVAVLGPNTSMEELKILGEDVFAYFGLGCRNISKMYLPKGYKIEKVMEAFEDWKEWVLHNKYKNNFDYNYAIYLLNKTKFFTNGSLITLEDESIYSRISCLHFSYYEDQNELESQLKGLEDQLQCVVSNVELNEIETQAFGSTQAPELWEYADGVDTMEFLIAQIDE